MDGSTQNANQQSGKTMLLSTPSAKPAMNRIANIVSMSPAQKATLVANMENAFMVSTGTDSESVVTAPANAALTANQQLMAQAVLGETANIIYSLSFARPYSAMGDTQWGILPQEIIFKVPGAQVGSKVYLIFTNTTGQTQCVECVVQKGNIVIGTLTGIGDGGTISVATLPPKKAASEQNTSEENKKSSDKDADTKEKKNDESEDTEEKVRLD